MATITKAIIKERQDLHGSIPTPKTYPEAASQTFQKGELVQLVAGYVTGITSVTPTAILGLAAEDGHNNATAGAKETSVFLASERLLFGANVLQASSANHVSIAADIGRTMGLLRDTTDANNVKWYLNSSVAGANARVFVHGFERGSEVGDTNARALFEFLPTHVQGRSTS